MNSGMLLAYYGNHDEGINTFRQLQRMGFHRIAWLSKSPDGEVAYGDPFLRRRILGAVAFALIGFLAATLLALTPWPTLLTAGAPWIVLPGAFGAVVGVLLSMVCVRRLRSGIERPLLLRQARLLIAGDTLVILKAPIGKMLISATCLLEKGETQPSVFIFHPARESPSREEWDTGIAFDSTQLQLHARRLAEEHRIDPSPLRNMKLLKRLALIRQWVQRICLDLFESSRLKQSLPPTAEWLLDNEYVFESNARDAELNLPWRYFRQFPILSNASCRGLPRIYALAQELVSHTDLRLDEDNILPFLDTYQSVSPLLIGELWAIPQMFRMALIEGIQQLAGRALTRLHERESADFWANRLIAANRRNPDQIYSLMAELTEAYPTPSSHFVSQLTESLYDEATALAPVQAWLERIFHRPMNDLIRRAKTNQTKDQISIANAFTSLRQLALLDWKDSFERLSRVEQTLWQDPADIYRRMDFATRNRYRQAIEELRRGAELSEEEIARLAINLAAQAVTEAGDDERAKHVGTYLIGEKRAELARLIGCRETVRFRMLHWAYRHHAAVYFAGIGFFVAAFIPLLILLGLPTQLQWAHFLLACLFLLPASQLSIEVMNYLILRLFPVRPLPKMDFSKTGIPDAYRTLVVVPILLMGEDAIKNEVEKLEIRYLANKEANLFFSIFTDYKDAAQLHCETDEALLRLARESIEALNRRYGEKFFLLHRNRKWCQSEQVYMGWERKRGKLEELNDLLVGERPVGAEQLIYAGNPELLTDVRFVITLDSDTQIPHDTARRMIETLAHPLVQPRTDSAGRVLPGSYTIIQPRVTPSLPSASGSPFSRLFSNPVGIDPYTNAVSDVYQDLTGEGSYHGKGIYDVRAFSRMLSGRFPEDRLLSHDLIEGAHVRVGLASDIELYDEFPQDYQSYLQRQHRWIRGDWQIAAWIFPYAPQGDGSRGVNPLSWFDRWKIFDNLRRSFIPVASLALLLASWFVSSRAGWIAAVVVATQLFFHSLTQPVTWATSGKNWNDISFARITHDLLRVLVEAALLPCQTLLTLDAVIRTLYRRHISRRGLLAWVTAPSVHVSAKALTFLCMMSAASLFSVFAGFVLQRWKPESMWVASPWLILWFLSLPIGWLLHRRPLDVQTRHLLSMADQQFLRNIARRTWRYFTDFVTEENSWLPPDNYQVSHQNQLALRTSPTNIGLYMASVLSAHEFGYVTPDEVVQRLALTVQTILTLERHEGHLLNWYDIRTLTPLKPSYVSTVDSGNLLGALWALGQGLENLTRAPLVDARVFKGLCDTGQLLRQAAREQQTSRVDTHVLDRLLHAWESSPDDTLDALRLLRQTEADVAKIGEGSSGIAAGQPSDVYWAGQIRNHVASWLNISGRYFRWAEILDEKTKEELLALAPEAMRVLHQPLHDAPSLRDLADGNVACFGLIKALRELPPNEESECSRWLDRMIASVEQAKRQANEMLALIGNLARQCREFSETINMRFLYNEKRRLFSIGFNISEGRLDRAFYDLLASEARLGSFVAIARGDIPVEHWFAMSRPYGAVGRHRALLSWTGTMFEYLMPLLFQRSYGNSLLSKATREAVDIQIAYGRKNRTPWGISESAYGDLDLQKTYQYAAFGVPELGLKRGLADKIVIAPYATLLAVGIAPREAMKNLRRLAGLGLLADYGYFEAVDFSRQPARGGERGVIVRTYMAHHHGMSFLSLTNFLHDDSVQRNFHADPRIRTVEPLLHERIPHSPPLHHISTRERVCSVANPDETAFTVSQFDTPHTATPKTQLLCNGRYKLMLTNAGGGYSRWGDLEITRWRSDRTQDSWGTFCYIRDVDTNRLWCNTYQPSGGNPEGYSVNFALDRAEFRRLDDGIENETEIIVAAEDDVEIRRMTLTNRSSEIRRLSLTSYIELVLSPHGADLQHPAFNKLFIWTEALPEQRALLACRRPRSDEEKPIYVAHRFTLEQATDSGDDALRFETDRRQFIGRGQTLASPRGAFRQPANSLGFVLDPILSLRQDLTLAPGQRVQISMVLAVGPSRDQVIHLMNKYGDSHAITRAMDFVWAAAQLELRLLRIQPNDARRFQQLASHLLYPNPLLRSSAHRIAQNRKGQAGLWAYTISGDAPIALVFISTTRDLGLVRQMLQAHTYWRMHGLLVDLVILNEEAGDYLQPLREELEHLIQSHSYSTGKDQPGGVFLRAVALFSPEDLTLLKSAASVVMVAARGALSQQLGTPLDIPAMPALLTRKQYIRDPSAALPFMELPCFNSLGGFTPDGREYAIYLGPDMHTPAPWVNVIANPSFGTLISESGAGFTWQGNSQRNRLTSWSNDPVMDPPSEVIYLRDEETGTYWTPTAAPIREDTAYRARHAAGYTVFEHNSHGIDQELTVFVPVNDQGGDPIKLQQLILHNDSGRTRKLSLTYYVEWVLGESRESSQAHVVSTWDDEAQVMTARNYYNPDYPEQVAFAAISQPPMSYTADRTGFLGRNHSVANPAAMKHADLARRTGAGLDPCAALRITVKLAPGERTKIVCMLGQAPSIERIHELVATYRDSQALEDALRQTKGWWDNRLGAIHVHTPDLSVDFMVNRWLLYQTLSCRMWGRSGFYQSGGAFGFRDQLQDVLALLYAYPQLTREQILLAASRQFGEGDVQHWWHPPTGAGVRSRVSDDLLWLPFVVAQYVRVTADIGILREMVPFLNAPVLAADQHERFQIPAVSSERATLFDHCRRALAHARRFGVHGLPLMGTGDWNDGMNLVGAGGKGESVWLAWFMAEVMMGMAEMSDLLDQPELTATYQRERQELIQQIENSAWDGKWYLRAFTDDGASMGASANAEAQIDSLPQSWAWLSGGGNRDRADTALDSAWSRLVREDEGLVLLFDPPFAQSEPSPGYIKGYPPGVRENGGQYTHAAIWLAMAMARRGDGTRAAQILHMLNPIEHAREPESVWRYGIEPYVVAADIYRLSGRVGKGGWSWYTGSAAWMYRAWVEDLLGLKVRGETLQVAPVIPGWWDGFQISYRHGEAQYEIHVENPEHCERGVAWVEMDGQRIHEGVIPLVRDLVKHRITIRMGRKSESRADEFDTPGTARR